MMVFGIEGREHGGWCLLVNFPRVGQRDGQRMVLKQRCVVGEEEPGGGGRGG